MVLQDYPIIPYIYLPVCTAKTPVSDIHNIRHPQYPQYPQYSQYSTSARSAIFAISAILCQVNQILPYSADPKFNQPIRIFHPRDGKSLLARLPLAPQRPSRDIYLPFSFSMSTYYPNNPFLLFFFSSLFLFLAWNLRNSTSFSLEAFIRAITQVT